VKNIPAITLITMKLAKPPASTAMQSTKRPLRIADLRGESGLKR
jgi:hypothetical protein